MEEKIKKSEGNELEGIERGQQKEIMVEAED